MKKKLNKIGKKAGLEEKEVKNLTKIGLSGLLAVVLAAFTGGVKDAKADDLADKLKVQPEKIFKENLPERCRLKPEGGPCKALFERYYYDTEAKKCKEFTYGGCEGVVPFETYEDCEKTCIKQQAEEPNYSISKYGVIGIKDFK